MIESSAPRKIQPDFQRNGISRNDGGVFMGMFLGHIFSSCSATSPLMQRMLATADPRERGVRS